MGELLQVVTVTTGYTGAPGYTNMFFFGDPMSPSTADSAVTAVHAFWETAKAAFPDPWRASIQTDLSIIDELTGDLIRTHTATGSLNSSGSAGPNYAGGAGACASWGTAAVHGKKRLRGRTFLVPLSNTQYDSDGTLSATALSSLRSAAATLGAVANFGVYGRPRDADSSATPPVTHLDGEWAGCTSGTVKDKTAILRSRRD